VYAAANGTGHEKVFVGAVGSFLNKLCSKLDIKFPTDGTMLNRIKFNNLIDIVKDLRPSALLKYFPVLGSSVNNILSNLNTFADYFSTGPCNPSKKLSTLWQDVNGGGVAMPQGGNMPNPLAFTSFFDALSEGSSVLSGVSQSNSSKLSYAQNQYNRLNAFVHSMLSSWLTIRKGLIRAQKPQ